MGFNKKFFTTGGIVASAPPAAAAFDPLQNFETVTYTGNGSTQKITGYIRKGAAFNGSSSYINFGDSPELRLTGSYSVSGWVNFNSITASNQRLITKDNANDYSGGYSLNVNSTNIYWQHNNGSATDVGYAHSFSTGTWYHFTITYDSSTTTNNLKLYINGSNVSTSNAASPIIGESSNYLFFGTYGSTSPSGQYFNGKLDQVRFFNKALDQNDIDDLYLETYADPKKSTTDYFGDGSGVALYELDEDANSSNFEQAAVFNGSSSRIALPKLTGLTADVSVSGWVNLGNTTTSNRIRFITLNLDTNGFAGTLTVMYRPSDGEWQVRAGNGTSSNATVLTHTYPLTQSTWYHICFTRNDASNETIFYVNGSEQDTESVSVSSSYPANATGTIGDLHYSSGLDYNWLGEIDQVRIYSSALGSGDVTKLYKESADVPTSTLVAHYKLDGDATDETENYDGTETSITYSAGVYGGTPTNVNFLGMAFQPDFVWIKSRDFASSHELHDSVRGEPSRIFTNNTNAASTNYDGFVSLDSNGFSLDGTGGGGSVNDTNSYVAWCWKAGGSVTPNNNTDGDITSTVSANPDAGFSIVKWTANGGDATIGHGISTPELIIAKRTDSTSNWAVQVPSIGNGYLLLNSTIAYSGLDPSVWNNTAPTSEVFSTAGSSGEFFNTGNFIAYCFHSVDGYQKVGSYTGQSGNVTPSSTNSIGFRPRFLIIKRYDGGGNWYMFDSTRGVTKFLVADSSAAEGTTSQVTFSDNGFSISGSLATANESSIYLAIA